MKNIFHKVFQDKQLFVKNLEHHSISTHKGFLAYYTEDIKISSSFVKYNKIYENTCEILNSGILNEEVNKLSYDESEINTLSEIPQITKIFSIMTVLTNSYLYFNRNNPSLRLPRQLAVPLYHSAHKLNILPVFCLWSSLHGVKRLDDTDQFNYENFKMRFSFTNSDTEDYFLKINFMASVRMNCLFDTLFNINSIMYRNLDETSYEIKFSKFSSDEIEKIKKELASLKDSLNTINTDCTKLFKIMDPDIFYHKLRQFLYGYSQFNNGIYFEGVNKTFDFTGASAGQDPYNMLLKAIMGISYSKSGNHAALEYENGLKRAIRKDHLNFIHSMEKFSLIKYLTKIDEFKNDYEEILKAFKNFYQIHNGFVSSFIETPAEKSNAKITGAGGTSLHFVKSILKHHIKKTFKKYSFVDEGENTININVDKNRRIILVNIELNSHSIQDLKILSKFTIEEKVEEILKSEQMHSMENRILILFSMTAKQNNQTNKMIMDGLLSIIHIMASKNIYTNKDIISIKYEQGTSEMILDETIEFLLTPGISKVMHSTVINFTKPINAKSLKNFQNAYSLVTGGARGIGGSTSQIMAEEGHNLIITARKSASSTEEYVNNLKKEYNISAHFIELNIGDPSSIKAFVNYLKQNQIYIKHIVHNAGVDTQTSKEQASSSKDANEVLIDINSIGTMILQEELEKSGMLLDPCRVLLVNTVGGVRPFKEFNPVDPASKTVLKNLAENLSNKKGFSAISIYPGATNTDMFKKTTLEPLEEIGEAHAFVNSLPKSRIIDPIEIGKIISFFLRDEISQYTNGCHIQASCGMNIDFRELPKSKQKMLTLPEAHFLCVKEPYHPIHAPKGKINFGTSQNYIMARYILKYLPKFFKEEDLHYSPFTGLDEFKKLIARNTGYEIKETIAVHTLESAVDLICHNFKNVYIENNSYFDLKNIISHSKVHIVDKENSACNIFILPDDTEIHNIINKMNKFTLIVIKNKSHIVQNNNKYLMYAYKINFSSNLSCGVLHMTNLDLINQLVSNHLIFCQISNIIQVAASRNIDLLSNHNIFHSLQMMFKNTWNVDLPRDLIHLSNNSSKSLDCIAKTLFNKDDLIALTTPLFPGFLDYLTRNGSKLLLMENDNKPLLEKILEAKEKGAKGYLICNPENPTGKVFQKDEIETICKWAQDHKNFYLIFDELYAYSCYSNERTFHSALEYTKNNGNIIVVRGFSKDFGLTGFKFGVTISSNKELKQNFTKWMSIQEPHAVTLAVFDEILKKTNYGSEISSLNKEFLKLAINTATSSLDEMGVNYIRPHAGLFIMIDLENYMKNLTVEAEIDLFNRLFTEYGLNITPGTLLKCEKPGMYRICVIWDDITIKEGLSRLKKFLISFSYNI